MSPDELRRHRENLETFQAAYIEWRDGQYQRSTDEAQKIWQRVNELEPAASRALAAAGRQVGYQRSPQAGGGMQYGLNSVLVAFNAYGIAGRGTLDRPLRANLVQAIAELRQLEDEERARRRRPLYWADRGFRLLVSPVGYVIHAVFDVDVARSSVWGPASRIASLACEVVAAVAAGRALGWW